MEHISAFNFAHEIVQTRTKKLEKNLNKYYLKEQFYQQFPSIGKNYGTTYVIHARKGGTEIISFSLVVLSQLKKISI